MDKKEEQRSKMLNEIEKEHKSNLEYFVNQKQKAEKTYEWFNSFLEQTDFDITQFMNIDVNEYGIKIEFNNMRKLHYIRTHLKMIMPKYKDRLDGITHSCEKAIVGYMSVGAPVDINYKLIVPMDKLPKSYTKDGKCGFKTRIIKNDPEKRIEFVCKKEKK